MSHDTSIFIAGMFGGCMALLILETIGTWIAPRVIKILGL